MSDPEPDSVKWRIFMPAIVDDLRLKPSVQKVLDHISRRAGPPRHLCWESVQQIAHACRLNKDTVKDALRELIERGMLERNSRVGGTSEYRLLPPPWKEPGGNGGLAPVSTQRKLNHPPAEKKGHPGDGFEGHPLAESEGHKGTPEKEIQEEGTPRKEGAFRPVHGSLLPPASMEKPCLTLRSGERAPTFEEWMSYGKSRCTDWPTEEAKAAYDLLASNGWHRRHPNGALERIDKWKADARAAVARWQMGHAPAATPR